MKKIASLLLALCFTTILVGCRGESSEDYSANESSMTSSTESTLVSSETQINPGSFNSIEELEEAISHDIDKTITQMTTDLTTLKSTIISYEDYVEHAKDVENFYDKINVDFEKICIRMQQYTVQYAELIMKSDISNDEKYEAFEDLLDYIYEDTANDLHDDVYEDFFDDIKDSFYDGVLDDSDAAPSYSEWYDTRSDEYDNWYDTRSDIYDNWYDMRSDIYDFYYDMRSELWSDDIERAEEILSDYKEDVEKLSD